MNRRNAMWTFGIGAIAAAIPTPQASATPSAPVPTAPVAGAQTGNAGPAAISGNLRRAVRNTIAAVGDSIIALGSYGEYQPWLSTSCYYQLPIMTHQRIRYGAGMFAVSGSLIQAAHDTQLPNVLAMNPLPGACILGVNTGSIANDSSYSFTTSVSLVKSMVASLLAAGVTPILCDRDADHRRHRTVSHCRDPYPPVERMDQTLRGAERLCADRRMEPLWRRWTALQSPAQCMTQFTQTPWDTSSLLTGAR